MGGNVDRQAADLVRRLRIDRGLTPEALALEVATHGGGTVSGRTIRRIEEKGAVPCVRVQFALAHYFDMAPSQVWRPHSGRARATA